MELVLSGSPHPTTDNCYTTTLLASRCASTVGSTLLGTSPHRVSGVGRWDCNNEPPQSWFDSRHSDRSEEGMTLPYAAFENDVGHHAILRGGTLNGVTTCTAEKADTGRPGNAPFSCMMIRQACRMSSRRS